MLWTCGCAAPALVDIDEDTPIGSVQGAFRCAIAAPDATDVDLGPASFDGELDTTRFLPSQRTQGCHARMLSSERGEVISVSLIQQSRFRRAQILELNLPVEALESGAPLFEDDRLAFVGRGGFGSLYSMDVGDTPNPFARVVGGSVLISEWRVDEGREVSGSFDALRMGDL